MRKVSILLIDFYFREELERIKNRIIGISVSINLKKTSFIAV